MEIERPKSKQPMPENAKCVFKGELFEVYQWEQEMFDGTKKIFEKVKRPDTVVIFPILPDGEVLLLEQEQPGKLPVISAPGGMVDKGENILEAAKRELLEETGYEAENFSLLYTKQPISKMEWAIYFFIAKGLRKIKDAEPDSGEKLKSFTATFDEFIDIVLKDNYYDPEIAPKFIEAKYDPKKKEELKELFKPLEK